MLIKDISNSNFPWYIRLVLNWQTKKFGIPLLPTKAWGRTPFLLILFNLFYIYLHRKKTPINPITQSLVTTKVAQLNSCHFCIDFNSMILLEKTGAMDKIEGLKNYKESNLFSDEERLAIEYAEVITKCDQSVSTELEEKLKKHFNEKELVELTALISFQNLSAKFNAGLNIPNQGLCKIEKKV